MTRKKAQFKIQAGKNQRFLVPQFSKKAQFKIQEMSFMLLAVVIFFILALLFFLMIKYRGMYSEAGMLEKEKTISTLSKLADTPEFSCGSPFCIDTDKLIVMNNREAYDGFFPLVSLSVRKLGVEEVECTENNYPDCSFFRVYDNAGGNEEIVSTFVSLCRKEQIQGYWYDKCELGEINGGFERAQAK